LFYQVLETIKFDLINLFWDFDNNSASLYRHNFS
jgi:hypothetical protein